MSDGGDEAAEVARVLTADEVRAIIREEMAQLVDALATRVRAELERHEARTRKQRPQRRTKSIVAAAELARQQALGSQPDDLVKLRAERALRRAGIL